MSQRQFFRRLSNPGEKINGFPTMLVVVNIELCEYRTYILFFFRTLLLLSEIYESVIVVVAL